MTIHQLLEWPINSSSPSQASPSSFSSYSCVRLSRSLLFTDCPQVLCPPEMSLASHMKLGRRAWPFAVGFPSCSREGTSRAVMASLALRGGPCLSGLSGLSFASLLPHSLCSEDGGLLLCHRLASPFLPQNFALPLPEALFSRYLLSSASPRPLIPWRLPGEPLATLVPGTPFPSQLYFC